MHVTFYFPCLKPALIPWAVGEYLDAFLHCLGQRCNVSFVIADALGVMDGAVGMRSLLDWVLSAQISGDPYTSALDTVVSKATADPEDREALITSVLDPVFAPRRRKTA